METHNLDQIPNPRYVKGGPGVVLLVLAVCTLGIGLFVALLLLITLTTNTSNDPNTSSATAVAIVLIIDLAIMFTCLGLVFRRRKNLSYNGEPSFSGYTAILDSREQLLKPYAKSTITIGKEGAVKLSRADGAQNLPADSIAKVNLTSLSPMGFYTTVKFRLKDGSLLIFASLSPDDIAKQARTYKTYVGASVLSQRAGAAVAVPDAWWAGKVNKSIYMPLMSVLYIRLGNVVTRWQTYNEKIWANALWAAPLLGLFTLISFGAMALIVELMGGSDPERRGGAAILAVGIFIVVLTLGVILTRRKMGALRRAIFNSTKLESQGGL